MSKFSSLFSLLFFVALHCANGVDPPIGVYELTKGDFKVKFTNLGASILSVIVPDRFGKLADIVLGYDTPSDYIKYNSNFGAIVGRVANRISGAQFTLNGTVYKLEANDGNNTLHGGSRGLSHLVWNVHKFKREGLIPEIHFTYRSPDDEGGFPGDLLVTVSYLLLENYQLSVTMVAMTLNKPTPVNLAQHAYWNLGGHNSGDVLFHKIKIYGSRITPVDSHRIPTGEIVPVAGTPYDYRQLHSIARAIRKLPQGYIDINYELDGGRVKKAAELHDRKSGRVMELWTNAPGMQFFTTNLFKDVTAKGGYVYKAYAGLCLETQGFPDAVNHPSFPSQIVTKEKPYTHSMLFKFSTAIPRFT